MYSKTLITIVGPTAVGKTALSIAFAKAYKTHIISCDSRQFYKEMTLGTAVPEQEELAAAPHHFIQNLSIHDTFTAGDFEKQALRLTRTLFEKHDVLIAVGGSALYEKALTVGLDEFPDVPKHVMNELQSELEQKGLSTLAKELQDIDPTYASNADLANQRRVLRALAVYRSSGQPYSTYLGQKKESRNFDIIKIGLEAPRPVLYDRINKRVDLMLQRGLLHEVIRLAPFKDILALKTVGYQEIFPHLEGKYDLEEAIRLVKRNSRRFAKRQMTWYRKDTQVHWYPYDTSHTEIVQQVAGLFMES